MLRSAVTQETPEPSLIVISMFSFSFENSPFSSQWYNYPHGCERHHIGN